MLNLGGIVDRALSAFARAPRPSLGALRFIVMVYVSVVSFVIRTVDYVFAYSMSSTVLFVYAYALMLVIWMI